MRQNVARNDRGFHRCLLPAHDKCSQRLDLDQREACLGCHAIEQKESRVAEVAALLNALKKDVNRSGRRKGFGWPGDSSETADGRQANNNDAREHRVGV